jgi:predicted RNA-binding Zn ribbon-like protein
MTADEIRQELESRRSALGPIYANRLCLDFANTLEPRGGPPPVALPEVIDLRDDFNDPYDVLAWGLNQQLLSPEQALRLWREATDQPQQAEALLADALALRDAVYRVFWSLANDDDQQPRDLETIRAVYAEAVAAAGLRVEPGRGVALDWSTPELRTVLWQVATATVDTLKEVPASRVKVCPGPGRSGVPCAWLFIDSTKNGSRRWCSMAECGSIVKTRRQSQRRRSGPDRSPAAK